MIMGFLITVIAVQGQCLPLRWRGEGLSPWGATDHQSPKRGEKVVTQSPTENPVEQSGVGRGRRIHVCIVVRLHTPTRSMGLGHKGTEKGWAVLAAAPETPPRHPAKRGVLHTAAHGDEERRNPVSFSARRRCQPEAARWWDAPRSPCRWESERIG